MAKGVLNFLESVRAWASAFLFLNQNVGLLQHILKQQGGIMATLAEVQAELTSTNEQIATERLEVQGKLTDLSLQVKALQDQIAQGGGASAADLDSILASIQAIKGGITQISEPNV
jgi:peptidoglycan hydrolase CwlO-like protein